MKAQNVILVASVLAIADLSARRFVGFNGGVCADGAKALGVTEADTEADNMAPANVMGVILVEAGAAIAAGADCVICSTRPIALRARGSEPSRPIPPRRTPPWALSTICGRL